MPDKGQLNIHQKILKIADAAGVFRKTKDGYGFRYVPEEEIQAKVTAIMQKLGVMLYCEIQPGTLKVTPHTYEKFDKKVRQVVPTSEIIVSADTVYTWVNADDPNDRLVVPWAFVGQMEDASMAAGAGLTYFNRYFLMKTLQLATTESDPDNYRSKQKEAEDYEEESAAKEAAANLAKKVKEVVDAGMALMKTGVDKAEMMGVVASFNDGNGNPSAIPNVEICEQVLAAFENMKKGKKE